MPSLRRNPNPPSPEFDLGTAGTETRTRSRRLMLAGVILAACAGIGSFVVMQRAQQSDTASVPTVSVVVASQTVSADQAITADELAVRNVPVDATNAAGTFSSIDQVVGRLPSITILPGQLVTSNMFTFSVSAGSVAILEPGETISPTSPDWRAVSISVPDDRALGGMLTAGEHVDIFVTTSIDVSQAVTDKGTYYGDKSTKVTYQDVPILAKEGAYYLIRVTAQVAEEIAQLEASGSAEFSFALRPDIDNRPLDTTKMGETTNSIIQRYGIPVPAIYPPNNGPIPTPPPIGTPAPFPTAALQATAPISSP